MNSPLDDLSYLKNNNSKWTAPNTFLKYTTRIQLLCLVIATVIAFYDIESIVFTGPVVGVIGILLLVLGRKGTREYKLMVSSTPLFCLCCFFLIVGLDWSPSDAQRPVSLLGGGYTTWILLFYFFAHSRGSLL